MAQGQQAETRPQEASLEARTQDEVVRQTVRGGPVVGVYAAATGLAGAVPFPFIDQALAGLTRGAAMRRVANRRGVRLTREAREILAGPLGIEARKSFGASLARRAAIRLIAPLRIITRIEEALATFGAAFLLDHYLVTADRAAHAPLGAEEAKRIRIAMERAAVTGVLDAAKAAPRSFTQAWSDAFKAAVALDDEDRSPAERFVDSLLDAAADAPSDLGGHMRVRFDRVLAGLAPEEGG